MERGELYPSEKEGDFAPSHWKSLWKINKIINYIAEDSIRRY
jgi:hypothetical protein